jgi:hypothetical protein
MTKKNAPVYESSLIALLIRADNLSVEFTRKEQSR